MMRCSWTTSGFFMYLLHYFTPLAHMRYDAMQTLAIFCEHKEYASATLDEKAMHSWTVNMLRCVPVRSSLFTSERLVAENRATRPVGR